MKRAWNILPVVGFCLALAFSAEATDNADVDVYLDYPAGPWGDWSWASHDNASTNFVHGHLSAMKVTFGAWTAIDWHQENGGLSGVGFTNLEFWVNGGNNSGQYFGISLTGNTATALPITNFIAVTAGQWKRVQVPLSALGVTNGTIINDVFLLETCGLSVVPLWIDDVRLTKPAPLSAAVIQVNAGTALATLPARAFGMNTAVWDWNLNSAGTIALLTNGGYTALRYPGGSTADVYDWAANKDKSNGSSEGPVNTAAFITLCNAIGAERMITVNYGSGSPLEASNWVVNANVTHAGNVLNWTIGNECYGDWEYDTNSFAHDATTYATFTRTASKAMKTVDARVKVGVVGLWDEVSYAQRVKVTNPRTGISTNGWSAVLLSKLAGLGTTPDFYEIHNYPVVTGRENDSALLQSASSWGLIVAATRQMLHDYLGTAGDVMPIAITENNAVPTSPGKQNCSLVDGLFLADSWAQAMVSGADSFVWWDLHNGEDAGQNNSVTLYGWRNYGSYGVLAAGDLAALNQPFPTYYAGKMLKSFARAGDALVSAGSNQELLHSYACLGSNGVLRLLVINEAASNDTTATISLNGYIPTNSVAKALRYGKTEDLAQADLTATNFTNVGTSFTAVFPAYSLTTLLIAGMKPVMFDGWRGQQFDAASLTNAAISGANAVPDGDGVVNLMEYAFNRNPLHADAAGMPMAVVQSNAVDGLNYLTLTYTRLKVATDITYRVEGSGSVTNGWTTNGVLQASQIVDQGMTQQVTARDEVAISAATNRFLRLHISQP